MSNKPNLLFLLAEDMCPNLGCYGDPDAITPNLDALSEEGMSYTHANSVAPVCSAARTTLALGVYPFTAGVGNHRSCVELPNHIKVIAKYMQEIGYFTAINKTDYNFAHESGKNYVEGWNEVFDAPYFMDDICVPNAIRDTWRNKGDKPFFFMHTYAGTHQSRYGYPNNAEGHRKEYAPRTPEKDFRDRSKLTIPPYHPDNADTREIWGQYHECISAMDRMVGETIEYLKEDGLYDDTIILFVGDNGMGIPGGKAHMWNEGLHVPMIIRVPEKYAHLAPNYKKGSKYVDEVSFIDIPRTMIRLGGGTAPEYMHGKDFLKDEARDYSFSYRNRLDGVPEFVRSVRGKDFMYIRNFFPKRAWRFSPYMAKMGPYFTTSWERDVKKSGELDTYNRKNAYFLDEKPAEELYDHKNDPYELNNIANDPKYKDVLLEMRAETIKYMLSVKDLGFIPEQEINRMAKEKGVTQYEVAQDEKAYPIAEIMELCNLAFEEKAPVEKIKNAIDSENPIVKYWGLYMAEYFNLTEFLDDILALTKSENVSVKISASETVINLTNEENAVKTAKEAIKEVLVIKDDVLALLEAVHCICRLEEKASDLVPFTQKFYDVNNVTTEKNKDRYTVAVQDIATYSAEFSETPFDLNPDKKDEKRLLIIRELKKKILEMDLA